MEWIFIAGFTVETLLLLGVYAEVKKKNDAKAEEVEHIDYRTSVPVSHSHSVDLPGEDDIPEIEGKPKRDINFFA